MMAVEHEKKVYLIEDDKGDARQYKRLLEHSQRLTVDIVEPLPSITEYAYLASDPRTGAILIDQRLSEGAGVPYEGTDVANFLRTLRSELPLIMLTNYCKDVEEDENEAIDSIFDKSNVSSHPEPYVSRLLRTMERYEDALTVNQTRLRELVDRKISDELTEDEEQELASLRADIERPIDLVLSEQADRWASHLQEHRELFNELDRIAKKMSNPD